MGAVLKKPFGSHTVSKNVLQDEDESPHIELGEGVARRHAVVFHVGSLRWTGTRGALGGQTGDDLGDDVFFWCTFLYFPDHTSYCVTRFSYCLFVFASLSHKLYHPKNSKL